MSPDRFTYTLKMEAVCSPETLLTTHTLTSRQNTEHSNIHFHRRRENFTSHTVEQNGGNELKTQKDV